MSTPKAVLAVLGGLPRWVWDLIAAIDEYENNHPKVDSPGDWGCIKSIQELIPEETRKLAGVLTEVGVLGGEAP